MGRLLVLSLLLFVMIGLRQFSSVGAGAHDPLILAAIGFVVMASYTAAEIGFMLSLPRVSGYIAAGLLLGPSAGNILTERVVQDMTMFNTLALGLIATGAGLELDLKAMRALLRTLLATVGAKVVLSGGLVFATFVAIESTTHVLGLGSMPHTVALGLVLGTLSIGTSPSITLALITETGARGRLADLTLGAAVIKDLVLVVLLAVSLAIGAGLTGQAAAHGSVGAQLARELGGSVAVGALLGILIIAYVRFVAAEMLLFVAGLVLAAAELSRVLHVDLLLVFIAAGCVVRNFSSTWEKVLHALETVSLPVFVVFFTIAGARINVDATLALLPVALALSAVRAGAFFVSARIGATVGGEGPEVRRLAWQAYLPQAGVTLGLLGLAVEALGPELGKPLSDIGLACVAVNLAIGPVTQRRALQLGSKPAEPVAKLDGDAAKAPSLPAARASMRAPLRLEVGHAELDRRLRMLHAAIEQTIELAIREGLRAQARRMTGSLAPLFEAEDRRTTLQRTLAWAREGHAEALAGWAHASAADVAVQLRESLKELPPRLRVPLDDAALVSRPGDSRRVRLRKLRARLQTRLGRRPVRVLALRTAANVALSARLAGLAAQLQALACRQHARVLVELHQLVQQGLGADEVASNVSAHLADIEHKFRADADATLHAGFEELLVLARELDGPERPARSLRYSEVEPEVRARLALLDEDAQSWKRGMLAAEQGLWAVAALARLRDAAEEALERHVLLPLAEAADMVEPALDAMRARLREALAWTRDSERDDATLLALEAQLRASMDERGTSVAGDRFRAAGALHAVTVELRSLIDALPDDLRLLSSGRPLHELPEPARAGLRSLDLRSRAHDELVQDFVILLDLESRRAASAVQELEARVEDALGIALSFVESMRAAPQMRGEVSDDTLELALKNLELGTAQARAQLIAAHDAIASAFQAGIERLQRRLDGDAVDVATARDALTRPLQRLLLRLRGRFSLVRGWAQESRRWLLGTEIAQRIATRPDTPQQLRELLSRSTEEQVAPGYRRLFRIEADQDLRHSVGREQDLAAVVQAQRAWLQGGASSALIVGEAGSGRTTLMNALQVEITAQRLLRPEALRSRRREGLIRALGYELRCTPTRRAVLEALRTERTAVLVDDLEQWVAADAAGPTQLRELLSLIRQTRIEVFWTVSCSRAFLDLVGEVVPVEEGFGHVTRLAALSPAELRRAIEMRHSLSGMTLVMPQVLGKLPSRLLRNSDSDLVFRLLHSVSGGNPSAAFGVWLNSVKVDGQRVHVLLDRLLGQQLGFGEAFDTLTTATLSQLHRYGPLSVNDLSLSLGVGVERLQLQLVALRNAGLIEDLNREIGVPAYWRALLGARLPARARWRG